MDDAAKTDAEAENALWPERPWLLAGLGALAGLLIHLTLGDQRTASSWTAVQNSVALFIAVIAALVAYTAERRRIGWALGFSLAGAFVIALIAWWNGTPDDWSASEGWRLVSAFLAVAIAAPLFQTARDQGAWRFPYSQVHDHAWANVVIWFASWAFVGATMLLAWLLAELFGLIGIDLIKDALNEQWFILMLIGTALGAGVGVLRKRDGIIRMLMKVVMAVLGVLAPVLGAGLVLFLLSLPFTGLSALWEATKSTTPILLCCVIGALILANDVIGDSPEDESHFPPLRWGAIALAVSILPLAIIAAISTGARIDQYGFTPDRLWALVFVIIACAYGLAYLVAVVRGRLEWAGHVRPANLRLAFALCGLALFLALPIVSFNAISVRDQVARLESGAIAGDKFDWAALRFDFGTPGQFAVERLAKSGAPAIRTAAAAALKAENRYDVANRADEQERVEKMVSHLRVLPVQVDVPDALLRSFNQYDRFYDEKVRRAYVLFYKPGDRWALLLSYGCDGCAPMTDIRRLDEQGQWTASSRTVDVGQAQNRLLGAAIGRGEAEIRTVERRQVFVGGKPVGEVFE